MRHLDKKRRFMKRSNKRTKGNEGLRHKLKKQIVFAFITELFLASLLLSGCSKKEQEELLIGAAASLKPAMEELKTFYMDENSEVIIKVNYAGSGALEQQITEGAPMDVFISAGEKQMNALAEDDLILKDTRMELLENQLVLITPKDSRLHITEFKDILNASVIALGDPKSVPAGQYAEEVSDSLGITKKVKAKATYGKDVTEVLSWVSSGNADVGVVYMTDAIYSDEVVLAAIAPEGSHSRIIYPAAVVKESKSEAQARDFLKFLGNKDAIAIFEKCGFEVVK